MSQRSRTALDVAVALVCFLLACLDLVRRHAQDGGEAYPAVLALLYTVATLAITVRSRLPTSALLLAASATAAATALGRTPLALDVAVGLCVYPVASRTPSRRAVELVALAEALLGTGVVVAVVARTAGDYVIHSMLAAGAMWFAGVSARRYRELARTSEERNRLLDTERAERARRALGEERLAIAREVHDVVAHGLTVVSVQAGVGARATRDAVARGTLSAIAEASRDAQLELRAVLTLLRGEEEAPRTPMPTLADLDSLAQQVRQTGTDVGIDVHPPDHLSEALQVTLYRITQEALTNAVKHAPGAGATVKMTADETSVTLRIENGPPPAADRTPPTLAGQGHGLAGMRERATAFAGRITAGPAEDGGFLVTAVIPLLHGGDRA